MRLTALAFAAVLAVASAATVMTFSRYANTCDNDDYQFISDGGNKVLWASSQTKPNPVPSYHGTARGSKSVNIVNPKPDVYDFSGHTEHRVITRGNMNVGDEIVRTTYWCTSHRLPTGHIRGNRAVIADPLRLHHVLLYKCPSTLSTAARAYEGACYSGPSSSARDEIGACLQGAVVAAWAVGGDDFAFPEGVGLPVDASEDYVMEVHYDNPLLTTFPASEGSGMALFYAQETPAINAGILMIGAATEPSFLRIPAGEEAYTLRSSCTSHCTKLLSADEPLHIFSAFPHGHLAARSARLRHFRGDTELKPILDIPNYDFNFQDAIPLREEVVFHRNDELMLEMAYNTESRSDFTLGGLSTYDEMSLAFLTYYPAVDYTHCLSTAWRPGQQFYYNCGEGWRGDTRPLDVDKPYVKPQASCEDQQMQRPGPDGAALLSFDASAYPNSRWLDADQSHARLLWNFDADAGRLDIAYIVDATGWIGLGLNDIGAMPGADMAVGWVGDDGSVRMVDRRAHGTFLPSQDGEQNWFNINGTIIDGTPAEVEALLRSGWQAPAPTPADDDDADDADDADADADADADGSESEAIDEEDGQTVDVDDDEEQPDVLGDVATGAASLLAPAKLVAVAFVLACITLLW